MNDTLFDMPLIREDNLLRRFEEIHDFIYAHDGLSPQETLEELIKILFIKIYDETKGIHQFGFQRTDLFELFELTKQEFSTLFEAADKINLSPSSLDFIVKKFQNTSLSGSSQDAKGLAFQKFLSRHEKSDRGQFFTPEPVINFCVQLMAPQKDERILDPACGSGSFLVSTLKYIQNTNPDLDTKHIINKNLFGIDINKSIARIAKMKLLLEDNTGSNIIVHNTLDSLETIKLLLGNETGFDLILTNPPFGAKMTQPSLLASFQLGYRWNKTARDFVKSSTTLNSQSVESLFIERSMELLKTGGRMAIVLPNGNFENSSLAYMRRFIMKKAKIQAIVKLPQESFIPYGTGVKTSLLFLEKIDNTADQDYPVFFGKITKLGYQGNKNGTPLYKKDSYGQILSDKNGNQVLDEDFTSLIQIYKNYLDGKAPSSSKAFVIPSSQIKGRLDFDYYVPEISNLITHISNKTVKLGEICEIVKTPSLKLKTPNGSAGYVELSDINPYTYEIINAATYTIHELPSRARFELQEGDIITAVAGNSVGTKKHVTALVSKMYVGCICTNGFRVLRNITINPYYLLYYMRTDTFLKQLLRYRTGAAIPAVSDIDMNNVIIEIPKDAVLQTIIEKMKKVFLLRSQAQEEYESIRYFYPY